MNSDTPNSENSRSNYLKELAQSFKKDLAELTPDNSEEISYRMTGKMLAMEGEGKMDIHSDILVEELFDLVAQLELPASVYGETSETRQHDWERIRAIVEKLDE